MADSPRYADERHNPTVGPDRGSSTGMPRWAKVSAIVVLALIVLILAMLLIGGPGGHGPGRH